MTDTEKNEEDKKKIKKMENNPLSYSLYEVADEEENKFGHVFTLFCTNGRAFNVHSTGRCDKGELLLVEYEGVKRKAIYRAELKGKHVVTMQCIKGSGCAQQVPLSRVNDHRKK